MSLIFALLAVAAPQTAPAPAASAAPCPAGQGVAPGIAGWSRAVPTAAGRDAAQAATLAVDVGSVATLQPAAALRFALPAGKTMRPGTYGGVLAFTVAAAGRYRVALGGGAWVDVIGGDAPLASVAHGHGPACSGIRKTVDYDLRPGRYVLQVSGSAAATLPLMVAHREG